MSDSHNKNSKLAKSPNRNYKGYRYLKWTCSLNNISCSTEKTY